MLSKFAIVALAAAEMLPDDLMAVTDADPWKDMPWKDKLDTNKKPVVGIISQTLEDYM